VWVDEGDGTTWSERWMALVAEVAPVDAVDVAVPIGGALETTRLDGTHGLFVCGGLTPAYAEATAPDVDAGLGLDEDTAWLVTDEGTQVLGRNAVHRLEREPQGLRWRVISAEQR
jgi:cyanophycinase